MSNTILAQRQRWFRSFPEGTIEFLLVTRILSIFLLLALIIMRESQRPMVFMALGLMLLADYVLMLWWVVQTAADLQTLQEDSGADPSAPGAQPDPREETHPYASPVVPGAELQSRRLWAVALACLPAVALFLVLTPWPGFVFANPVTRAAVWRVLLPVAAIVFVVFLIAGQRALQRFRLGPSVWTTLLLVPFMHWFAMHRLVTHLRGRLELVRQARGETTADGPALAVPIADVTWVLAVLPWVFLIAAGVSHEATLTWRDALAPCGVVLTAVFAVADVAAMEGLQRQLAAVLRRPGPARP